VVINSINREIKMGKNASLKISGMAVVLILFILAIPSFADISKTWGDTLNIKPGGKLIVEADIGAIIISTNDNDKFESEVYAEVDTRDEDRAQDIFDRIAVDVNKKGQSVILTLEYNKKRFSFWKRHGDGLKCEINISIPSQFDVELMTAGGSIEVKNLEGSIDAETSGGSLAFENTNGFIRGRTSGGSISMYKCIGDSDIKTSGGSITLERIDGDVEAHTSGGSITLDEIKGAVDASTSGGSITAYIVGQPNSDCRLATSGGSINIKLDRDINVTLNAETSAGRVETDFPVTIKGKIDKSRLRGEINDGGPELYLRTSAGNIYLSEI